MPQTQLRPSRTLTAFTKTQHQRPPLLHSTHNSDSQHQPPKLNSSRYDLELTVIQVVNKENEIKSAFSIYNTFDIVPSAQSGD